MSENFTTKELIKALRDALEGARDVLADLDPELTDDHWLLGAEIEQALKAADGEKAKRRMADWVDLDPARPIDWERFKRVWVG